MGVHGSSVIQAAGTAEFEDGSRIRNHSEAQNGLQRVPTLPEINANIDSRGKVDQIPPGAEKGSISYVAGNQGNFFGPLALNSHSFAAF